MAAPPPPTPWPKPETVEEANKLLGPLRGYKTKKVKKETVLSASKIASVTNDIHKTWYRMDKELRRELLRKGRAGAEHICLPTLPVNNWVDEENEIHSRLARYTIARVLVHNRHGEYIKAKAIHAWIDNFLPTVDHYLFDEDKRVWLKARAPLPPHP